jgi:hypothetical protein
MESPTGAILSRIGKIRDTCAAHGLDRPIVMSEGSWGKNEFLPDPADQVAFLARYQILQAGARKRLQLLATYWYAWGAGNAQSFGNIANADNTPTPAGAAFGEVASWLSGKAMTECAAGADGTTYTCAVTDPAAPGYRGLVAWTTTAAATFAAGAPYSTERRLDGSSGAIDPAAVSLGPEPVLLEGP